LTIWVPLLNVILLLATAMVLGSIAERLKQSAIVGFMLAGLLLGPNVAGKLLGDTIVDRDTILMIADLGVTLLMFTIGLEFSWSRLRRLGVTALGMGAMQILITMGIAIGVTQLFGYSIQAGIAIGAVVSLSSTGVVMPALARRAEADSVHGRFALGILLVQDIAVIPLVLVVAALGGSADGEGGGIAEILISTGKSFGIVAGFVVFFVLFSKYVLPRVVAFNAPTGNRDVTVLFAIVLSLGAAWAAWSLDLSPALGAFIAAIFLGESVIAPRLRGDVGPLKVVFVTLFFSSIGMLADPVWIFKNIVPVAIATGLLITLKPMVIWFVGRVFKVSHRHALAAGVCMAQVGVFSFVLAKSALDGGVIEEKTFSLIVSFTILTLFATPYWVALGPWLGFKVEGFLRKVGWVKTTYTGEGAMSRELSGHTIIIGFGPAGRAVANAMYSAGNTVVVVDLNPQSVAAARDMGMRSYVGDASSADLLKQVGINNAEALVITLPDHRLTMAVIIEARELAPRLQIIARARYHRYVDLLDATGASIVIDEEATVGDRLSETLRVSAPTDPEQDHKIISENPPTPA
jgi:CPA2 family monovalent cation:H+ antiporter-2